MVRKLLSSYNNLNAEDLVQTKLYRFLLQVKYTEFGINKMSYLRYSVFGVLLADLQWGTIYMAIFGFFGYLIGRFWYRRGLIYLDAEIGNQFNKFQQELREFSKKNGQGNKYK